jgi:hypothetical protein
VTPASHGQPNVAEPVTGGANHATELPGQQRWEFVRAFVAHSWTRPNAERSVARPHIVLLVATLAAAVALGTGVVFQLIWPVDLTPAAADEAPKSKASGFTAVAGWDCLATATSGFDAAGRQAGWYTAAEGGWAQDGCYGTFELMPMSGKAAQDDARQNATWWFSPGTAGRCTVMVYVPTGDRARYRPAPSAHYLVLAGRTGQAFAEFVLDQNASPGSWATVGTYPVDKAGIAVRLVNRGEPPTPDTMLAITQVKVDCTSQPIHTSKKESTVT